MIIKTSVYSENPAYAIIKTFSVSSLRSAFLGCVSSIFFNFFFRQYRAVLLKGKVPVSNVDHPLDEKIPFVPSWITIYLDFVAYWVRLVSFLLRNWRHRSYDIVNEFVSSIGKLYAFAAQAYRKNFSTTKRPFYIARPRFFLIHLVDPHLMCIPSLHIMVVIHTYTMFSHIARMLGEEDSLSRHLVEMKQGAMAISQAILYVKQHSVNCVAAGMYAMTCFDPVRFSAAEAENFISLLFGKAPAADENLKIPRGSRVHPSASPSTKLPVDVQAEIKSYILALYRRFLSEKKEDGHWSEPLLNFMFPLRK